MNIYLSRLLRSETSPLPSGLTSTHTPPSQPTNELHRRVVDLEDRVDRLVITCMAMWSLVQQHAPCTEEDLMERIKQIDLLDGQPDGKITRQIVRCSTCNRVMSPRHRKCIYCGAERLIATAFDPLA